MWGKKTHTDSEKLNSHIFSGAGKTVSAKYIMRYFATADDQESVGRTKKTGGMTEVEEQILGMLKFKIT